MAQAVKSEAERIVAMPAEDYMNALQQDYFRRLLQGERALLLAHIDVLGAEIKRSEQQGDEGDKAAREEELRLLFRQIDRESRLLPKIDAALQRLRDGEYGYCRATGEPIGLRRLMLRPTAELSVEAKMTQERKEAQYRK